MNEAKIRIAADAQDLIEQAAALIGAQAGKAIAQRGAFSIALSGGSTPRPIYERLTREPYRSGVEWDKTQIYFGDERCVGPESDQSNYHMAQNAMLNALPIAAANVHRIRGEIDPNEAATEYGGLLKSEFKDGGLDLILLGMGPDGHTASLFPHTTALSETRHRCVANYVEKMNAWRVTLSAPFINRSRAVLFIVAGADKARNVERVLNGPQNPQELPSQLIRPENGELTWLLDADAAANLRT